LGDFHQTYHQCPDAFSETGGGPFAYKRVEPFGARQEARLPRTLTRDTRRGVVAGVAAGFGRYLDVDPVLARLGFVLLTFVNGLGLLIYLAGWALMPRAEPEPSTSPTPGRPEPQAAAFEPLREAASEIAAEVRKATSDAASPQLAVGSVLVVLGSLLLAHNLGLLHWPYWLRFETLWPLLLVALGLGLVAKSRGAVSA
jgi:phage shock protein PspC (stress-responsive transcriptional regulator)